MVNNYNIQCFHSMLHRSKLRPSVIRNGLAARSLRRFRSSQSRRNYAKGVRAKFRYIVARFEPGIVLNFDLTPFAAPLASTQDLPTTNHVEPKLTKIGFILSLLQRCFKKISCSNRTQATAPYRERITENNQRNGTTVLLREVRNPVNNTSKNTHVSTRTNRTSKR